MKQEASANPILDLARRALSEQWPAERLNQQLEALGRTGIDRRLLQDALEAIRHTSPDQRGGQFIALVGKLCAALLQGAGHVEAAGAALFEAANGLKDRYDSESF